MPFVCQLLFASPIFNGTSAHKAWPNQNNMLFSHEKIKQPGRRRLAIKRIMNRATRQFLPGSGSARVKARLGSSFF